MGIPTEKENTKNNRYSLILCAPALKFQVPASSGSLVLTDR